MGFSIAESRAPAGSPAQASLALLQRAQLHRQFSNENGSRLYIHIRILGRLRYGVKGFCRYFFTFCGDWRNGLFPGPSPKTAEDDIFGKKLQAKIRRFPGRAILCTIRPILVDRAVMVCYNTGIVLGRISLSRGREGLEAVGITGRWIGAEAPGILTF